MENPKGSNIFTSEESPIALLQTLEFHTRDVDQCMKGAPLEGKAIKKSTSLQSSRKTKEDTVCDGSHEHLHLRGTGPGGSRTAQSALYPDALCDDWLHEIVPEVSEGGDLWMGESQQARK